MSIFRPATEPIRLPGGQRANKYPDLSALVAPALQSGAPLSNSEIDYDELVVVRAWRSYDDDQPGVVKYFNYELAQRNPGEAGFGYFFKAVRMLRLTRVPRYLRNNVGHQGPNAVFEGQRDILAALREQQVLFTQVIARSPELPLVFSYGVQAVGATPEEAQRKADESFAVLTTLLDGVYQQLEYAPLLVAEGEALARYQNQWNSIAIARGRPLPTGTTLGGSAFLDGNRTDVESTNNQLEAFIRGMGDKSFMLTMVTVPLAPSEMSAAWRNLTEELSKYRSDQQGTRSISAGMALPIALGATIGDTTGTTHTAGTGDTLTTGTGLSTAHSVSDGFSTSVGQSFGTAHSVSQAQGISDSQNQSLTDTAGHSTSASTADSTSHQIGTSQSATQGTSQSATQGTSQSATQGTNQSTTAGSNHSTSDGTNQSTTQGTNQSTSQGNNQSTTSGINHSASQTATDGNSQTNTQGTSTGTSTSVSDAHSVSQSASLGVNQSQTQGVSVAAGVTNNTSSTQTVGSSIGASHNIGTSNSTTDGTSTSTGVSTSHNDSTTYNNGSSNSSAVTGGIAGIGTVSGTTTTGSNTGSSAGLGDTTGTADSSGTNHSTTGTASTQNGLSADSSSSTAVSSGSAVSQTNTNSQSQTQGQSATNTVGTGQTVTAGSGASAGASASTALGISHSTALGTSDGSSVSATSGSSASASSGTSAAATNGTSASTSSGVSAAATVGSSASTSSGTSASATSGTSASATSGTSLADTAGRTVSAGSGDSTAQAVGTGSSAGSNSTSTSADATSQGTSNSTGRNTGTSDTTGANSSNSNAQSISDAFASAYSRTASQTGSMGIAPNVGVVLSKTTYNEAKRFIGDLLEAQLRRYQDGIEGGAFLYQAFLVCPDDSTMRAGAAAMKAAFWGPGSTDMRLPEAFHTAWRFAKNEDENTAERKRLLAHAGAFTSYRKRESSIENISPYAYSSYVTPGELSSMTHPPITESLGLLAVHDSAPVMALPYNRADRDIYLGHLFNGERGKIIDQRFGIDINEMTHTLITGVTGSGKTTALMRLLEQISRVEKEVTVPATIENPYPTTKMLRPSILALDWMRNIRDLQSVVEPERFRFYSVSNPKLGQLRFNPIAIPVEGMAPMEWINRFADLAMASWGLLDFGRSLVVDHMIELFGANRLKEYTLRPAVTDTNGEVVRPALTLPAISRSKIPEGGVAIGTDGEEIANVFTCPELSRCISIAHMATLVAAQVEKMNDPVAARTLGRAFADRVQSLWRRIAPFAPGDRFAEMLGCDPDPMTRVTLDVEALVDRDNGMITVVETEGLDNQNRKLVIGSILLAVYMYGLFKGEGTYDHNGTGPGLFVVAEEANELFGSSTDPDDAQAAGMRAQLWSEVARRSRALGMRLVMVCQNPSSLPEAITANTSTVIVQRTYHEPDRKRVFDLLNWSTQLGQQIREYRYIGEMSQGMAIVRLDAKNSWLESAPVHLKIDSPQLPRVTDDSLEKAALARKTLLV